MHRIDGEGATPDKRFTEGNPITGVVPTVVTAAWLNDVQENIWRVLIEAEIIPVKGRDLDLWDAIVAAIMLRVSAALDQMMAALAAKTFVGMPDTPANYQTPVPYVGGAILRVRNAGDQVRFADNLRAENGRLHVNFNPADPAALSGASALGLITAWMDGMLQWRVGMDGATYANGPYSGSGADYAERFESLTGAAIAPGTVVVLDQGKVRAAAAGDDPDEIFGVVRPEGAAGMVGNDAELAWAGRYLTDDYGAPILTGRMVWRWFDDAADATRDVTATGPDRPANVPDHAVLTAVTERAVNPAYVPGQPYVPRSQRPEWVVVGLLGQIPITNGQPVNPRWRAMATVSGSVTKFLVR